MFPATRCAVLAHLLVTSCFAVPVYFLVIMACRVRGGCKSHFNTMVNKHSVVWDTGGRKRCYHRLRSAINNLRLPYFFLFTPTLLQHGYGIFHFSLEGSLRYGI